MIEAIEWNTKIYSINQKDDRKGGTKPYRRNRKKENKI